MKISILLARAAQFCPHALFMGALTIAVAVGVAPRLAQAQAISVGYQPPEITIGNDLGGDVGARANQIAAMRASGQAVAIRGPSCYSACTMYLALPGSCISRGARFGFHRPSGYGRTLSPDRFEFWSRIIASHYPAPLQSWYMQEARHSASLRMVSGDELIRMGVPECG